MIKGLFCPDLNLCQSLMVGFNGVSVIMSGWILMALCVEVEVVEEP